MSYKRIGSHIRYKKVMEETIGRSLQPGEAIHHIDLDKTNDDPTNLHLCETNRTHKSIHAQLNKLLYCLGKELLKKKIISFDCNKQIYHIPNDINNPIITDISNKINLKEEEINQIIQKRKEIIKKSKEPRTSFWDTIKGRQVIKQIEEIDNKPNREWEKKEDEEMFNKWYINTNKFINDK